MLRASSFVVLALSFIFAKSELNWLESEQPLRKDVKYPEKIETLKTLEEFMKLVEENKLNVSLILSTAKNWSNGNLKRITALTMQVPVNSESLTDTELTSDLYRNLERQANEDGITVAGTRAEDNILNVITNNQQGLPINTGMKIFSGIKRGQTGFVFTPKNYAAQYTFLTNNKVTTKVFHGDINVEIVGHSDNINDKQLSIIKKAIVDSYFTFNQEDVPRSIYSRINQVLPDFKFDVAGPVGATSWINSDTWAKLKVLNTDYFVYKV